MKTTIHINKPKINEKDGTRAYQGLLLLIKLYLLFEIPPLNFAQIIYAPFGRWEFDKHQAILWGTFVLVLM